MIKTKIVVLFTFLCITGNIVAQSGMPAELTDETQLMVLNSRFGSRFSFSFSTAENAVRMGALGYDLDEPTGFYLALHDNNKKLCFRTIDRVNGAKYFEKQELDFGLTQTVLNGLVEPDINIRAKLVSPFCVSESLDDSANIKVQIVPAYYLIVQVENNSKKAYKGKLQIGFKKTAIKAESKLANRSYRADSDKMYFRDNSDPESKLILGAVNPGFKSFFNYSGINGIEKNITASAGEISVDTLVVSGYYEGKVVKDLRTNLDLNFYYTKFWKNADDVYNFAKINSTYLLERSSEFEKLLVESKATPEEKWVSALTFKNDMANTFLLVDKNGGEYFYVEEGRFQHLSTIDVAHETELTAIFAPWRLKMQIEQWSHYLALGETMVPPNKELGKGTYLKGMSAAEYGPYLFHDVGDFPFVDYTSNYNYGPYMSVEENTDFVLLLYWYWKLTGNDEFVQNYFGLTDILLQSLINRDTDDSGIADAAIGWTTYDANEVLKMSPENTYLGVKQLCSYAVASEMFSKLAIREKSDNTFKGVGNVVDGEGIGFSAVDVGNEKLRLMQSEKYLNEAVKILNTLKEAKRKYGFIPISLNETFSGWDQRSVVISEGLFLPGLSGAEIPVLNDLAALLKDEYKDAFSLSKSEYGIRLIEKENTTWFSKVMVSDIVASYWFGINNSTAGYTYEWNRNNPFAYNDGAMNRETPWGGNWYPRGVPALLYLFRDKGITGAGFLRNGENQIVDK